MRRFVPCAVTVVAMLVLAAGARAIDTKTALDKLGFPADTQSQVLAGEFVETALPTATERDLNVGIAFLVKQPPDTLARTVQEEMLMQRVDPATIAYGKFDGDGTVAQLAGLKLTPGQQKAYADAKPGEALNLSSEEVAALKAAGKDAAAIQDTVHELLLARYRAYRTRGLAGIAAYARQGARTDPAADLAAVNATMRKGALLPLAFYELLDNYPKGAPADATEILYWSQFTAHGEDTIALVHTLQATFGGTLIGVQRHYYVSTGYNIEQAITGFLPAEGDTLVIYTNHTSTDQVAGFGSSVKRGIGRKFMAGELKKLFEKARATAAR
ncbi:MAG TPA: hypothetical protein VMS96_07265 [Terriglobales bacterium]|nr:hypothetical protein [Terriglobales bacterium]